jgi:hypothetical protein
MVTNDERTKTRQRGMNPTIHSASCQRRSTVRCIASDDMSDAGVSDMEMYAIGVANGPPQLAHKHFIQCRDTES